MSLHRLAALAALTALPAVAGAESWTDKVSLSGWAQSDVRFNIDSYRGEKPGDGYNFSMNRNDLDLRLEVNPLEGLTGVADGRLRYFGFSETVRMMDTNQRAKVDPFSVELDQAYVAVRGLPFSWMDLKVGRMVQTWGSADMFNPTDNLNGRDFSDPLDYTRKVPNQMVQVDLYPSDWLTLTAVWVPVFKPSQLPSSAALAFATETDANGCLASTPAAPLTPENAEKLAESFAVDPCALNFNNTQVLAVRPRTRIQESQAALRAKLRLGDVDLGLSYYYGRFSFPVAITAVAQTSASATPGKMDVAYTAEVMYPRMQVAGLDFSYGAPWLFDIGFRGELAVIFPEEVTFGMRAYNGDTKVLELSNVNVPSTPFVKATVGLDYTFTWGLYVNAMYVRGFFDEFNDLYGLHNYVVLAPEYKFLDDSLQLRVSAVLDLNDLTNSVNPQLTWIVVPGVEVVAGAFLYGGHTYPLDKNGDGAPDTLDYSAKRRFGQKASGRNVAFLRTKFTW